MASMHYTLFVGDLSIFCTEADLRELFETFGELSEVKIIRCEETKKNLSYGFVKYEDTEAAVKAIDELNGFMLCGRPLRIGWASRRNKGDQMMFPPFSQSLERSSVHVTYSSNQIDNIVTEEYFMNIFSKYGTVIDAAVKRFEINEELQCQKGYGFVHFAYTSEGVAAAVKCCDELHNRTLDKVQYKCSISHRLRQCMNGGIADEGQMAQDAYEAYNYPPMALNPFQGILGSYPMSYAYNAAGMLVPVGLAMAGYQQYQNPYMSQMSMGMGGGYGSMPGQMQTGVMSPMPSMSVSMPVPMPVSMQYTPQYQPYNQQQLQQGGYYNEHAPAGVYAMPYNVPYTWGYPQYIPAEEGNVPVSSSVPAYSGHQVPVQHPTQQTNQQTSHTAQVQPASEQTQMHVQANQAPTQPTVSINPTEATTAYPVIYSTLRTYNDHPHGPAIHTVTNPHTNNNATNTTNNTNNTTHTGTITNTASTPPAVVTGFGVTQRPTASQMAEAVHGSAPFMYSPYGGTPAYTQPTTNSTPSAHTQSNSPAERETTVSVQQYPHSSKHSNAPQQYPQATSDGAPPGLRTPSPTLPVAPRTKTWAELFQSAAGPLNGNNVQAAVNAPLVPPPHSTLQVIPPHMTQQPHTAHQQQHKQHNVHQQGQQHNQQGRQSEHKGAHPAPHRAGVVKSVGSTAHPSHPLSDADYMARREAAMMVIGTGPSTGQSILVSSLRPRRDKQPFRNANLSSVVPRQRGPSITPRSTKLAAGCEENVMPDGIAASGTLSESGKTEDGQTETESVSTNRSPGPRSPQRRSPQRRAAARGVHNNKDIMLAPTNSPALSPSSTHEDTALDCTPVVSPSKVVHGVLRLGGVEGRGKVV